MTLDEIDALLLKLTEIVDLRKIIVEKDKQIDGLKQRLSDAHGYIDQLRKTLEGYAVKDKGF